MLYNHGDGAPTKLHGHVVKIMVLSLLRKLLGMYSVNYGCRSGHFVANNVETPFLNFLDQPMASLL